MRAYWGGRPLPCSVLTASRLTDYGIDASPGPGRRVWVETSIEQLPCFYYHPAADTSEWVNVRLENVGEYGAGRDLTLDTVALGSGAPLGLLITAKGEQAFWGGTCENQVVELLTLEPHPRLLLKSESSWTKTSFGRVGEAEIDEGAYGEQQREQIIRVRNGVVSIGPVQVYERLGATRGETAQTLRTVPMTMLPPGRYRYQDGRLVRISR